MQQPRNWLKEIRVEKNKTQEEVAEAVQIERPYYSMIESGVRNPSVNVAKRIAGFLGFEWAIFFDSRCNEVTHKAKPKAG